MARASRVPGSPVDSIFRDVSALNAALAGLPPDTFVVAFFLHSLQVSQDEWMEPLARHLRAAGFATVAITTPQSAAHCRLDATEFRAVLPLQAVPHIEGVQVFIISDIDCLVPEFPQKSRILACCHGVLTTSDTAYASYLHHIGLVDGWLCSAPITSGSREKVARLWTGLASTQGSRRQNRHLHFIPVGYPRLAVLAQELEKTPAERDAIVYAPTILDYHPEVGGERVRRHGERILRILLGNFPGHRVIFRPYRGDRDHPVVRDICQRFRNERRFVFDSRPERLFSFAHGATLVTDISHIGKSFAYATLRAPVYFQPWQKAAPALARTGGVFKTSTYSGLIEAVRTVLGEGPLLAEELRAMREREIMPFATAFEDIAALLEDFYEDRPHDDWLTVERCDSASTPDDEVLIERLLGETREVAARVAATAVMFGSAESPLLAAFALHQGVLRHPGRLYHSGLRTALESAGLIRMEESDWKAARRLYANALTRMQSKKNEPGKQLVEGLLAAMPPEEAS